MSTDDRIRAALHATAVEPEVDDVPGRVTAKRVHRRNVRRVEAAVAGMAAIAIVAAGALVLVDDSTDRQVAVPPGPSALPQVRVASGAPRPDAGPRATVRPVHVAPDEGYLRGPLLEGKGGLALTAYDRSGSSYTFPPSRIVRVDANGEVVDRIDLQGEILSLTDGEGARWALTRDKTVMGPLDPEFRVKRIGGDGTVASNPVPPGEQPVGAIVAGGGGIWVPTRTAVLRFDVVTGELAATIPMSVATERRAVVSSVKAAYVTDGPTLKRLDPSTDQATTDSLVAASRSTEIVDGAASGFVIWTLGRDASGSVSSVTRQDLSDPRAQSELTLPEGFDAATLHTAGDFVWAEGTLRERHVILIVQSTETGLAVARTIRLARTDDANVVFGSPDELLLTSKGSLYRVRIPG